MGRLSESVNAISPKTRAIKVGKRGASSIHFTFWRNYGDDHGNLTVSLLYNHSIISAELHYTKVRNSLFRPP